MTAVDLDASLSVVLPIIGVVVVFVSLYFGWRIIRRYFQETGPVGPIIPVLVREVGGPCKVCGRSVEKHTRGLSGLVTRHEFVARIVAAPTRLVERDDLPPRARW